MMYFDIVVPIVLHKKRVACIIVIVISNCVFCCLLVIQMSLATCKFSGVFMIMCTGPVACCVCVVVGEKRPHRVVMVIHLVGFVEHLEASS